MAFTNSTLARPIGQFGTEMGFLLPSGGFPLQGEGVMFPLRNRRHYTGIQGIIRLVDRQIMNTICLSTA